MHCEGERQGEVRLGLRAGEGERETIQAAAAKEAARKKRHKG